MALGRYENFPIAAHCVAFLICGSPFKKVQRAIIDALYGLNQETYPLNSVILSLRSDRVVSFEFGVAEGLVFNYLDSAEKERLEKTVYRNSLPVLDFFCVIRYHTVKEGRKVPLRFDYQMLRFTFEKNSITLQIFHERGIQRISFEDFVTFLVKRINIENAKHGLKPLKLKTLETR